MHMTDQQYTRQLVTYAHTYLYTNVTFSIVFTLRIFLSTSKYCPSAHLYFPYYIDNSVMPTSLNFANKSYII